MDRAEILAQALFRGIPQHIQFADRSVEICGSYSRLLFLGMIFALLTNVKSADLVARLGVNKLEAALA